MSGCEMAESQLRKVQRVNALPFSQACLQDLKALKYPVEDWELYTVQLLIWGVENHKLALESEYQDAIPMMLSADPDTLVRNLKLAELKPQGSPVENAALMVDEFRDRILGIPPEEEAEEEEAEEGDTTGGGPGRGIDDIINGLLEFADKEADKAALREKEASASQEAPAPTPTEDRSGGAIITHIKLPPRLTCLAEINETIQNLSGKALCA